MTDICKSHKITEKQVTDALKLLKDRRGSTTEDIYFVLDNLHGKIQRNTIQCAIKSALSKGIISVKDNRYLLQPNRKSPTSKSTTMRSEVLRKKIKRGNKILHIKDSTPKRNLKTIVLKARLCKAAYNGKKKGLNNYIVPVRNFECRITHKPRTRNSSYALRSKTSYQFTEVSSSSCSSSCDSASCVSSSSSTQSCVNKVNKKTTQRNYTRKCPLPKVEVKLEPNVSQGNVTLNSPDQAVNNKESCKEREGTKSESLPAESLNINNDSLSSKVIGNPKSDGETADPPLQTETTPDTIAERNEDSKIIYYTRARSVKEENSTLLATTSTMSSRTSTSGSKNPTCITEPINNSEVSPSETRRKASNDKIKKVRFLL